jgi:hypothetical protein
MAHVRHVGRTRRPTGIIPRSDWILSVAGERGQRRTRGGTARGADLPHRVGLERAVAHSGVTQWARRVHGLNSFRNMGDT